MHFKVQSGLLAEGLRRCGRGISSRPPADILSNVLIEADGGVLFLTTTDFEIVVHQQIPSDTIISGAILVDHALLASLVHTIKNAEIEFELKGAMLHLKYGTGQSKLNTIPAAQYPSVDMTVPPFATLIKAGLLIEGVAKTHFTAASNKAGRPNLEGIHFMIDGGDLHVLAADGYRMSRYRTTFGGVGQAAVTVPVAAAREIGQIFSPDEDVQLAIGPNRVMITSTDDVLILPVNSGNFPTEVINNIVNSPDTTMITMETQALRTTLQRAQIFSGEDDFRTYFSTQGNKLTISTSSINIGADESEIDIVIVGDDMQFILSGKYIKNAVDMMKEDQVVLAGTESMKPFKVIPAGGSDYIVVISPMGERA